MVRRNRLETYHIWSGVFIEMDPYDIRRIRGKSPMLGLGKGCVVLSVPPGRMLVWQGFEVR
jgi:hypothetical protein